MTPRKPKPARELAARALCRKAGLPEDSTFEGRPMWESFLPEADAVLEAIGWVEDETRQQTGASGAQLRAKMMTDDQKQETMEIEAALGRSLIAWNHLEATIQLIVYRLGGGTGQTDILTARLSAQTLLDVLETLVNEFADEGLKSPLLHLHTYFSRLKGYRNDYFHGIRLVAFTNDGEAVALSESREARGRLTLKQESVTAVELNEFTEHCRAAQRFAGHLVAAIYGLPALHPELPAPTWQEMPALPDKKKTFPLRLLNIEPPQTASQE